MYDKDILEHHLGRFYFLGLDIKEKNLWQRFNLDHFNMSVRFLQCRWVYCQIHLILGKVISMELLIRSRGCYVTEQRSVRQNHVDNDGEPNDI